MQLSIPQWEREHGRPLMINGSRFIDDLVERLELESTGKENKRVRFAVFFSIETCEFDLDLPY